MPVFQKRATVPYTASEMYRLVSDIPAYPEFLSGCREASILEQHGDEVLARLGLAVGGIHFSFTSRNRNRAGQDIQMQGVDGPFERLEGRWQFSERDAGRVCEVDLHLEFALRNALAKYTFGAVFGIIVHSLVESFVRRAHDLYGPR